MKLKDTIRMFVIQWREGSILAQLDTMKIEVGEWAALMRTNLQMQLQELDQEKSRILAKALAVGE